MMKLARTAISTLLLLAAAGCPGPTVAVSISPESATVSAEASQQFTATVTGASDTAVTWSVKEGAGGSISNTGQYTAPSAAGSFTVVAASKADSSKSASATVTVTLPTNVSVSVSPAVKSVNPGQQVSFTATVTGTTNTAVTWSVQESGGGTISTAGVYTAPATTGAYTVVATSVADSSQKGTATVTVTTNPVVAVTISPRTVTVMVGALQSFTATVTGTSNAAVTWSVQESGGGTVTGGTYTAPATAGTFHVVATSVADASVSDAATVTVTTTAVVSVSISPTTAVVATGGTQGFTATVSGSANTAVTWSVQESGGGTINAAGLYTAPATTGAYTVVATSVADTAKSATATVIVALPAGPTLSGSVAYAGGETGRIYLALQTGGGGPGTSLAAQGAFTIRGVRGNGSSVTVRAFMDVLGTGAFNYAADPVGQANVTLTGGDITGVSITLAAPPAQTTPGQAGSPDFLIPAADSILVALKPMSDSQGRELATGYKLYWSTTPNPGPANKAAGAPRTIPAGGLGLVYLGSPAVTAGGTYYFSVSALNGALEGPVSAQAGPATVAAPTGGTTVSGQISFSGLSASGPFLVGVYSESAGASYTRLTGTTSPQAFSIPGVQPPGDYFVFSAIDTNGDGLIGTGDPQVGFNSNRVAVAVGGTPVTGVAVTLPASDSTALIQTRHSMDRSSGNDNYVLAMGVTSNLKRPVKVALTSGPNVNVPVDVGLQFGDPGGGGSQHRVEWPVGAIAPAVGQTYVFDVTYLDGSSGTVSAAVSGIVAGVPTAISPSGAGAPITPTLTWTLPGSLPSPYSQRVWVGGNTGGSWNYDLPNPGATSVLYNVDGRAGPLSSGGSYSWNISIEDQYGNAGTDGKQFSVP